MDDDLLYHLSFSHFLGIGPIRLKALINYFGSVRKAYRANREDIKKVIGYAVGDKFVDFRRKFNPIDKLAELKKKNITVLSQVDKKYPEPLRQLEDPPICLYIRGKIDQFDFNQRNGEIFFAIVGTRQPTAYGEQVTKMFAKELAQEGVVIVSGLAYGIDVIAHQSVLEVRGKTIAVLGCGVDIIYPIANAKIYHEIVERGGWVISEFPPGQTVVKGLFIARNRIISGLSSGVLIVEGSKDSGTLITVRHAAEQGKEVFAIPSPITSPMSEAPNIMLKQGAKLVTNIQDIFDELGIKMLSPKKKKIIEELSIEEEIIYKVLNEKPSQTDEISQVIKQPINQTLNILSLLEIKGLIEKNFQGKYQIKI